MTTPDLAELRRLLDAATQRPWSTVSGAGNVWHFPEEGTPTVVAGHQRAPRVPDALLIAAAMNALPALLDAAAERDALAAFAQGLQVATDSLRAERDALAAKVEALADWHETKADKARRFRIEIDGRNPVMDKAAEIHTDAARRLRAALDEEPQP